MANINITGQSNPLAQINLKAGESAYIQQGSMVYKTPGIELKTRVNANNKGLGGIIQSIGRSIVSGESFFITEAFANNEGTVAIAPSIPGSIEVLECGPKQYRINDGAFLAMEGSAHYQIKSQGIGKAIFGKTGGLFVMETTGTGKVLINSFGNIIKLTLNNDSITIDNGHVLAWDSNLNYNIQMESGLLHSIGTGEGLVNTFTGTGDVYIQTVNMEGFSSELMKYLPLSKGS